MDQQYEPHHYDPKFPIIFHYDIIKKQSRTQLLPHWHENLELLYITHGNPIFVIDTEEVSALPGEIVVVPPNALHQIDSIADESRYYCLIIDRDFCSGLGFDFDTIRFQKRIRDLRLNAIWDTILKEFEEKDPFYQTKILASIVLILVSLSREYIAEPAFALSKAQITQLEMVKRAFMYIEQNYQNNPSADELAHFVGFSKYYFCHVFKEITGMTPVNYINSVRCRKAKKLLSSGRYNVGEAAALCGFCNVSYFTKTYKKFIGELPSESMTQFI